MDLLVLDNPIKVVGSINRICAALAAKHTESTEGPFCGSAEQVERCPAAGAGAAAAHKRPA